MRDTIFSFCLASVFLVPIVSLWHLTAGICYGVLATIGFFMTRRKEFYERA